MKHDILNIRILIVTIRILFEEVLTAAALEGMSAETQKRVIGEKLFPLVERLEPELVPWVYNGRGRNP